MPPAFVLFWLLFIPKGSLHLRTVPWMMLPPLLYGAWALFHGAVTGWYPYPFIDVGKLGYPLVFLHIIEFVFGLRLCRRGLRLPRPPHPPPRNPVGACATAVRPA